MGVITLIVILFHLASTTEPLPTNSNVHEKGRPSELFTSLHPCGKFCFCNRTYADCSGHYDKLTYIPKLNNGIEMLNFSSNSLENISISTFENMTKLHFKALLLRNNSIKHISENALQCFPELTVLELAENPISQPDLRRFLHGLNQSSLKYLNLENLHLHDANIFDGIHNVQRLVLHDNLIKNVDCYAWKEFKYLASLDISYNKITKFRNASILKVEYLNLRSNHLKNVPKFCKGMDKSTLQVLDLSHNNIESVTNNDVKCLTSITKIFLISNKLKEVYSNTFSSLPNLVTLQLNHGLYYHGSSYLVEDYAFNNSALTMLTINSLERIIFTKFISPNAFGGCVNLKYLSLSHNNFEMADNNYLTSLLCDLRLLGKLTMDDCRLSFFPVVIAKLLTNIVELDLYFNNIQTIKIDCFKNLKRLKRIDLGHNGIVVIDSEVFPLNLRHQLTHINLAYNSFICTCTTLWLIEWMKMDSKIFLGFPKYYRCGDTLNHNSTLMINAPLSDIVCSSSKMFPSVISVSGVTVVILAVVSLVYRWRWHIRHYIYVLRFQRNRLLPNEDVNFTFDAFALFCDDDFRWVTEQLMPKIEDEGGKRLCIHHRDFTPGKYIVDNIIESLEDSRKVILVLSNTFSDSSWCDFELTLVQKRALEMQGGYLVVILLEDIQARNMTSSLYALLQTTTYITWPEEEQDQNLFWERVRTSLEE